MARLSQKRCLAALRPLIQQDVALSVEAERRARRQEAAVLGREIEALRQAHFEEIVHMKEAQADAVRILERDLADFATELGELGERLQVAEDRAAGLADQLQHTEARLVDGLVTAAAREADIKAVREALEKSEAASAEALVKADTMIRRAAEDVTAARAEVRETVRRAEEEQAKARQTQERATDRLADARERIGTAEAEKRAAELRVVELTDVARDLRDELSELRSLQTDQNRIAAEQFGELRVLRDEVKSLRERSRSLEKYAALEEVRRPAAPVTPIAEDDTATDVILATASPIPETTPLPVAPSKSRRRLLRAPA